MLRGWISAFWQRVKALLKRRQLDRDLAEELEFHLAMREQKLVEQGMLPREAHDAARRDFGNVVWLKETSREMWSFPSLESWLYDFRSGLRMLAKSPGFTAVVVLTLALGIGANTAIFTVIDTVLLRSLPVKDPDRLAMLTDPDRRTIGSLYCYRAYTELRSRNAVFSGLLARSAWFDKLYLSIDGGRLEPAPGELVSGNYFAVLGVQPYLGRTFSLEDEGPPGNPVAVLSYDDWRVRFAGDPGSSARLSGFRATLSQSSA